MSHGRDSVRNMGHEAIRLADVLDEVREQIESYLVIGKARWHSLVDRVRRAEHSGTHDFADEQVWTFLAAAAYAAAAETGVASLSRLLTGTNEIRPSPADRIWFEVLPMSPRMQESNTNVDLAVGSIRIRGDSKSGIELAPHSSSWVCLVEAKWYSDLGYHVEHHQERNQLARVAENAACFQSGDVVVDDPFVALLTPSRFRDGPIRSRWYRDKFTEYSSDASALAAEWDHVADSLPQRVQEDWRYPDSLDERAQRLRFNWVTYEDLFSAAPESPIRARINEFATEAGQQAWCAPNSDPDWR